MERKPSRYFLAVNRQFDHATIKNLLSLLGANLKKKSQETVNALRADMDSMGENNPNNFLVVDFKLVSIGTHPQHQEQFVALIVCCLPAAPKPRISLFDLAHSERILLDSGLSALLESDRVLKVMHDVRRVVPVLAQRYGTQLRNVFDTQVMRLTNRTRDRRQDSGWGEGTEKQNKSVIWCREIWGRKFGNEKFKGRKFEDLWGKK